MSRIKHAIGQFWKGERDRQFLWLPVLFAAGIALYFALPSEPSLEALVVSTVVLGLLSFATPRLLRPARFLVWAMLLVLVGTSLAAIHTARQSPTVMRTAMTPRPVSGTLVDIERVEKGLRLTLKGVEIAGMEPADTPRRVRLSLRLKPTDTTPLPIIGTRVQLLAGLLPPMGPAIPGGFDFARYFFFRDIGAIGYGLPPWKTVDGVADESAATQFQQWRFKLTERIITTLGPQYGPIAAGLITGEDRAIAESDFKALRAANLYHIIAISGGHMVVIAGVIFLALRFLFLLLPGSAGLRPGAKSLAAAVTLVMITLYLGVTGMPISAVRAYVMIALVLTAVILRREVDAMRSLMLAALIMLLIDPSDLLEPGFQLSFVATLAIIALAESRWLRPGHREGVSKFKLLSEMILGAILISVVAEGATSLLVLGMFNTLAPYGVLANAMATPLVAIVIMPTVALFFVLLPFGLETHALHLMEYGIRAMMWIANTIAAQPHAQLFAPSPPEWGIACFIAGLLVLCIVRQRLRYMGLVLIAVGVASALSVRSPDLLVGQEIKQIAMRTGDGPVLARGRADSMLPELWANALGYEQLPMAPRTSENWRCDRLGCIARIQGKTIAFTDEANAFAEDCARADVVVTRLRLYRCNALLIGPKALAQGGVHAFWLEDAMHVENSTAWQGHRPWSAGWRAP